MERPKLLLLGASVRAAAASCLAAGIDCAGVDLFADEDARKFAKVVQANDYPAGLAHAADKIAPTNWMYTGGLENYPRIIERVTRKHRLWGNDARVLKHVRNPFELHLALKQTGLPTPEICRGEIAPGEGESNTRWLRKPVRSCGGMGIRWLTDSRNDTADTPALEGTTYLQKYVDGEPVAAIYLAVDAGTQLLGITRQLIGQKWSGALEFQYAGSIGPVLPPEPVRSQIASVGSLLASQFGLQGLFGVDGVVNADGFWTLEVNPRYTASIEVLERAGASSVMARHASVFLEGMTKAAELKSPSSNGLASCYGKAIVFARSDVEIGDDFRQLTEELGGISLHSFIADIPPTGTRVGLGQPICTVFVEGDDEKTVKAGLQSRTAEVRIAVGDELRC